MRRAKLVCLFSVSILSLIESACVCTVLPFFFFHLNLRVFLVKKNKPYIQSEPEPHRSFCEVSHLVKLNKSFRIRHHFSLFFDMCTAHVCTPMRSVSRHTAPPLRSACSKQRVHQAKACNNLIYQRRESISIFTYGRNTMCPLQIKMRCKISCAIGSDRSATFLESNLSQLSPLLRKADKVQTENKTRLGQGRGGEGSTRYFDLYVNE